MINFKEYQEGSEAQQLTIDIEEYFENEDIEILYEGSTSKAWIKAANFFLYSKVNSFAGKVKAENDVSKKLDLIADQNRWLAAFINLGVAASVNDKAVYKKGR